VEVYEETVVEAGVDWLTARERRPVEARALIETGKALAHEQLAEGYPSKDWGWYGFQGKATGAVRWGTGDRGAVLIVSGPAAHKHLRGLRHQAQTITRIDLCATVRINPPSRGVSTEHYTTAVGLYQQRDGYPKPSMWVGSDGGITFYLGDRSSAYFGRVYDKAMESKSPAYEACWRYEVECKAAVADCVASLAAKAPDLVSHCAGYVWGWFHSRGITPRYTYPDAYHHAASPLKEQTDANTLGWLTRAVAPSVKSLLTRGLAQEVYEALGLTL